MHMEKHDYLMKALLDTQERVRDFMNYSKQTDDPAMQEFFHQYALTEGLQAQRLQKFLGE